MSSDESSDHSDEDSFLVSRKKKNNILNDTYDNSWHSETSNVENSIEQNESAVISDTSDEESVVVISGGGDDPVTNKSFMTPQQKITEIVCSDTDDNSESDGGSDDVIEDSYEDEKNESQHTKENLNTPKRQEGTTRKQPTLDGFVRNLSLANSAATELHGDENSQDGSIRCSRKEYNNQMEIIGNLERQMVKTKTLLSTIKLSKLSDGGQLLKDKFEAVKNDFLRAQERLRRMAVIEEIQPNQETGIKAVLTQNWTNIQAGIASVQPKTFGKKGLENHTAEKALTSERLEQLHGSLKNCPDEEHMDEDPVGLKVSLRNHQKRALAWLSYRETQKPRGGILADDMGLGKTLTLLSLLLKTNSQEEEDAEREEERDSLEKSYNKYKGGTLVVCPASLIHQWAGEIDTKLKRGIISYNIYHGPKRELKAKRLANNDVVITTYSIVMNEHESSGAIFRIKWNRLILDEAHQIRNHKSKTSLACCDLSARNRWALTGTPVHNKELDMYALLKFLRCSPFDDLSVWKRWVCDKNNGGGERLSTLISSLMLRRTKAELMDQGKLTGMPTRKFDLIPIHMDESEMGLYQKVLLFSQRLFQEFLCQREEKSQIASGGIVKMDSNEEYFKMRKKLLKLNKMKEINQHEILMLLLRLRQICCHPSLILNMLQGDEDLGDEEPEQREEINLLEQLNKLTLEEHHDSSLDDGRLGISNEPVGVKEAAKGILNPSHPIFEINRSSSKIKSMMKFIPNILSEGDKVIIVSQWSKFLEIVGLHLKSAGMKCLTLDGSVPTSKRTDIVTAFNDPHSKYKILLLSLTAGGVGLNLVGANHLFLIDLHWNPQLENQAQDRIYRMGQKKNVHIYKFMTSDTIEERIKKLQETKLSIAENMMNGSKIVGNKLSLQDLKMLFNM